MRTVHASCGYSLMRTISVESRVRTGRRHLPESLHQLGQRPQVNTFGRRVEVGNGHFISAFGVSLLFGKIPNVAIRVAHDVRVDGR